jgi:hypothetical protein
MIACILILLTATTWQGFLLPYFHTSYWLGLVLDIWPAYLWRDPSMPAATPPYYNNWGNYTGGCRRLVTLQRRAIPVMCATRKWCKAELAAGLNNRTCLHPMLTVLPCIARPERLTSQSRSHVPDRFAEAHAHRRHDQGW